MDKAPVSVDTEPVGLWQLQIDMLVNAFDRVVLKLNTMYGDGVRAQLDLLSILRGEVLALRALGEEAFRETNSEEYKFRFSIDRHGVRESQSRLIELLVRIAREICVAEYFYNKGPIDEVNGYFTKLENLLSREDTF